MYVAAVEYGMNLSTPSHRSVINIFITSIILSTLICKLESAIWSDFLTIAIQTAYDTPNDAKRSFSYQIFQQLFETLPTQTLNHINLIITLIGTKDLIDPLSNNVRLNALKAYTCIINIVTVYDNISLKPLVELLPTIINLLMNYNNKQSEEFSRIATSVFDVLSTIVEIQQDNENNNKLFIQFCQLALSWIQHNWWSVVL